MAMAAESPACAHGSPHNQDVKDRQLRPDTTNERGRPDVQKKRRSFRREVKRIEPERLVFVDETGGTTAMTSAYAVAPPGERADASAPRAWESVTGVPAL